METQWTLIFLRLSSPFRSLGEERIHDCDDRKGWRNRKSFILPSVSPYKEEAVEAANWAAVSMTTREMEEP